MFKRISSLALAISISFSPLFSGEGVSAIAAPGDWLQVGAYASSNTIQYGIDNAPSFNVATSAIGLNPSTTNDKVSSLMVTCGSIWSLELVSWDDTTGRFKLRTFGEETTVYGNRINNTSVDNVQFTGIPVVLDPVALAASKYPDCQITVFAQSAWSGKGGSGTFETQTFVQNLKMISVLRELEILPVSSDQPERLFASFSTDVVYPGPSVQYEWRIDGHPIPWFAAEPYFQVRKEHAGKKLTLKLTLAKELYRTLTIYRNMNIPGGAVIVSPQPESKPMAPTIPNPTPSASSGQNSNSFTITKATSQVANRTGRVISAKISWASRYQYTGAPVPYTFNVSYKRSNSAKYKMLTKNLSSRSISTYLKKVKKGTYDIKIEAIFIDGARFESKFSAVLK